jgi:hypothetical protein
MAPKTRKFNGKNYRLLSVESKAMAGNDKDYQKQQGRCVRVVKVSAPKGHKRYAVYVRG